MILFCWLFKTFKLFFVISLLFVIFFVHRKLEVFRKYSMHCSYICSLNKLFFVEIQLYEPFVWFFTSTLSLNTLIQSTIFWLVVVLSVLFFFTCNLHREPINDTLNLPIWKLMVYGLVLCMLDKFDIMRRYQNPQNDIKAVLTIITDLNVDFSKSCAHCIKIFYKN